MLWVLACVAPKLPQRHEIILKISFLNFSQTPKGS